jgi:hypothetical protein
MLKKIVKKVPGVWHAAWPKIVLRRYKITLFGSNLYIYDFKKFDLVKDSMGNYIKTPDTTSFNSSKQKMEFLETFNELVRIDLAEQIVLIKKREELVLKSAGTAQMSQKKDASDLNNNQ